MLNFNRCPVRCIFEHSNGSIQTFSCQRNFAIRLSIHILVTNISGVLVDAEITVYRTAQLMMKAERAILSNFNTKSCIFQRMFAVKERGCCRNSGGLLNHPSISAQSECPNIRRFEGDSYSAAHVRLAELIVRQIVAEFKAQIFHGASQPLTAVIQ
ncbi:hypothetical protein D3C75_920090 [compost metagenome]